MAKNKSAKKAAQSASGRLRIIGGSWRSRLLPVLDAEGLRPTSDRVRETLFNWLQQDIPGSCCLDLFAGSGALGFEAASRGAQRVVMVEKNTEVARQLKQNRQTLEAEAVDIITADAMNALTQLTADHEFDIVFLDPPYQAGLLQPVLDQLQLQAGCKVYIELNKQDSVSVPAAWECLRDKTAGQIHYSLYQVAE